MSTQHTPTRLDHSFGRIHSADRTELTIANIARAFDGDFSEANARRLVACWNALLDAPTELLERAVSAGITDVSMGNLFSSRMELQAQRDELLAVLHMALPALEAMRKQWPRSPLDDSMDVVEVVRAAIAKVKGGAV